MTTRTTTSTVAGLLALVGVGSLILGGETRMGKHYELVVPDYASAPARRADEMTNALYDGYNATVDELVRQLGQEEELSNYAKCQIIYLLGELRAVRATSILIKNIDLEAEKMDLKTRIARWSRYPAREALVKIGRGASGMIMAVIGSHKFDKTKVQGYSAVLAEIGTPRYALMKLRDRLEKSKEEEVRKQYEMVIVRIEQRPAGQEQ